MTDKMPELHQIEMAEQIRFCEAGSEACEADSETRRASSDASRQNGMNQGRSCWSWQQWLLYGTAVLQDAGIEDARTDAWLLMEYLSGMTRSAFFLQLQEVPEASFGTAYQQLLSRRSAHIPLQYLTHEAWCYGNRFYVDASVLIPRQDTEILIETAEQYLRPGMKILDLCTGSGCILISLLKQMQKQKNMKQTDGRLPDRKGCTGNGSGSSDTAMQRCAGIGSDISEAALQVARRNAAELCVEAEWVRSDLFSGLSGTFDLIVSNPPYIPAGDIKGLQAEVRDHEPYRALDGGEDGLDFYRRITEKAGQYLVPDGKLCLEIGYDQGEAVRDLMKTNGFESIRVIQDYAGLNRVVTGVYRGYWHSMTLE